MMQSNLILMVLLTAVLVCSMCRVNSETAEIVNQEVAECLVAFTDENDLYLIDPTNNKEPELISNDTRGTGWSMDGKTLFYLQVTSSDLRGMSYELGSKSKTKLFNIPFSRNQIAKETYWGAPGVQIDVKGNNGIRISIHTIITANDEMTQSNLFAYDFMTKKLYGDSAPQNIVAWRDDYADNRYVDYLENRLVKGSYELFNVQSKYDPQTGTNSQKEIQLSHVSRLNLSFEYGSYEEIIYDLSPKADKLVYSVGNTMGDYLEGYNVLVNLDGTKETYVGKSGRPSDKFFWMSNGNLLTCENSSPENGKAILAVYDANNTKSIIYKSTGSVTDINPRP